MAVDTDKRLTLKQILAWADDHHRRTGYWPISRSGPIPACPERTWEAVNSALAKGGCGLSGGDSLARLLERRRGVIDTRRLRPDITRQQILDWVDDHRQRTGQWPTRDCGVIHSAPDLTWATVDRYLKQGGKHLPAGSSLSLLLREARGVWDGRGKPRLTKKLILKWAREHYDATGKWPVTLSGKVRKHPEEDWAAIDMALRNGRRGLPEERWSLSRLLAHEFGDLYRPAHAKLTIKQIVAWANEYKRRKKNWPTRKSGPILGANGMTWGTIDGRLKRGGNGLSGGITLAQLLDKHCR